MSLIRDHGHPPNVGILSSPRCVYMDAHEKGFPWAADNDAFLAWDEKAYTYMLERITGMTGCLFVVVPDIVGDAAATLKRFHEWAPRVRESGQPLAFVVQDGIGDHPPPWDEIDALFIGGAKDPVHGDRFKLGEEVAELVQEAKRRGLWVHMGRVNTHRRIRYAASIGCDSFDDTNFSMFRQVKLPKALRVAASGRQGRLVL